MIALLLLLNHLSCSRPSAAPDTAYFAGSWKMTDERANGQSLWIPYYQQPCRLDDLWYFHPEGRYEIRDSGLQCSHPAGNGRWLADRLRLQIDSTWWQVEHWEATELTISRLEIQNGFSYRRIRHYQRP